MLLKTGRASFAFGEFKVDDTVSLSSSTGDTPNSTEDIPVTGPVILTVSRQRAIIKGYVYYEDFDIAVASDDGASSVNILRPHSSIGGPL